MTWPNDAERADWFRSNLENPAHRPAVEKVGAGWAPACGCPDPACERAEDDSRRIHPTWDGAWHAARINIDAKEAGA